MDRQETKRDAYLTVAKGRAGSLANNPTEEYLEGLRNELYRWLEEVHVELFRVIERNRKREL